MQQILDRVIEYLIRDSQPGEESDVFLKSFLVFVVETRPRLREKERILMGEFVVEVPAGVKPGERFAASVGNGRKVAVGVFFFIFFLEKKKRRSTIYVRYDVRREWWLVSLSISS